MGRDKMKGRNHERQKQRSALFILFLACFDPRNAFGITIVSLSSIEN